MYVAREALVADLQSNLDERLDRVNQVYGRLGMPRDYTSRHTVASQESAMAAGVFSLPVTVRAGAGLRPARQVARRRDTVRLPNGVPWIRRPGPCTTELVGS